MGAFFAFLKDVLGVIVLGWFAYLCFFGGSIHDLIIAGTVSVMAVVDTATMKILTEIRSNRSGPAHTVVRELDPKTGQMVVTMERHTS